MWGGRGSPAKRKAGEEDDEAHVVETVGGVTLDNIKQAFKAELSQNNERMKKEIQQAVGNEVAVRIGIVETEVTKQLKTTLAMLESLTDKHTRHTEELSTVKAGQAELEQRFATETKALRERVEAMELRMQSGWGGSAQSTATGEVDAVGAPKQPALIIGGWEGGEVLAKATDQAERGMGGKGVGLLGVAGAGNVAQNGEHAAAAMVGHKRKKGERWEEWHKRTVRLARAIMHREGVKRWSTHALERI